MTWLDGVVNRFTHIVPITTIENVADAKHDALVKAGAIVAAMKYDDDTERVDPFLLELLYMRDPESFNGVNVITKTFLTTKYNLSNDYEDQLLAFLAANNFHELLLKIIQHLCVYGNAWAEILYRTKTVHNMDGTDRVEKIIAGLDILDPKLMDFRRDTQQAIVFDDLGFPKEVVQYVPNNKDLDETKYLVVPQNDLYGRYTRAIIVPKADVVHFSLYTVGDNPVGIGLLEPLFNVVNSKKMIERGLAQSIHHIGFPILWIKIGNNVFPASAEEMNSAFEMVRQTNERSQFVTPDNYDIKILQSNNIAQVQDHLTYFQNEIISGMGIPKPFITGEGEGSKHTLEMQKVLFDRNIKMLQHVVSRIIETEIFARFAREHNFPNWFAHAPQLVWGEVSEESTTDMIKNIVDLVDSGIVTADKNLETYVRNELQLPPLSYDGGKGQGKPDSAFDPIQLKKGIQTEFEHTRDENFAKELAKDHLMEHPRYYDFLERMLIMMKQTPNPAAPPSNIGVVQ